MFVLHVWHISNWRKGMIFVLINQLFAFLLMLMMLIRYFLVLILSKKVLLECQTCFPFFCLWLGLEIFAGLLTEKNVQLRKNISSVMETQELRGLRFVRKLMISVRVVSKPLRNHYEGMKKAANKIRGLDVPGLFVL
jgi:hypothetical protein